jgi:outer membrane protein
MVSSPEFSGTFKNIKNKQMKKLPIILSSIAFVGVIVLYILQFAGNKTTKQTTSAAEKTIKTTTHLPKITGEGLRIAYVNFDTLLQRYAYYEELKSEFEKKQKDMSAELDAKSRNLQNKFSKLQQEFDKGLITSFDAKEKQKELQTKQQELMQLRDQLSMRLAEEEQVMMRKLIHRIKSFLKNYNKELGYHIILSATFSDNVLYAVKQLNITDEVVEGLNEAYRKKKEAAQ